MDPDVYAYLGIDDPRHSTKKSSKRVESLLMKGSASSAKINIMKIKQKAKELKEMRSIPVINQKSKKIAEGLKRERLDLVVKPEIKVEEKPFIPEEVKICVDIIQTLDRAEQPPPKPDLRSMSMAERSKYWKEQKEKKLEEQRKEKKDKELDGCTFKPKKIDKQDFEIVNRPQSVKAPETKKDQKVFTEAQKKSQKEAKFNDDFNSDNIAFMLKGKNTDGIKANEGQKKKANDAVYHGGSLQAQPVRIKAGFLSELSKGGFK